ncbi:MAG: MmgE/PrpD family protein [Chloroflexota bacterium]|nr:MmgE/PrpD family protein [Chloroflexota bacterium]
MVAAPPRTAAGQLAGFCSRLRWDQLEPTVQARTLELLLDLIGVGLAGSRQPSSLAAADVAVSLGGAGKATVLGGRTTSAVWAALANGTAAHAVELDDVTTESSLHPGVAVIPAGLALAQELNASPAALLEAIVAGYEVTMRVGNALNPASAYARGFHPTGVAGVFGATMAAGGLLGLDTDALTHALGIAGTLASGSLEYLADGAWTKRLNPGWAGHAGITAARLARAGFTGPATVFEGRLGVLHAYTDAPIPERLLDGLGETNALQVMRVSIKPYACCRYNHGLIDCVLQLAQERHIEPASVQRIRLGVLSGGALLVAEPIEQKRAPQGIVDAQFSAPYAAAAALVFGTGGIDAYSPEKLHDPNVRRLMALTDCYTDPALDVGYPREWPAAAEVHFEDGSMVSTRVEYATGEPENPVSRAALVEKFVSLAAGSVADPSALAGSILALDAAPDLSGLGAALRDEGSGQHFGKSLR